MARMFNVSPPTRLVHLSQLMWQAKCNAWGQPAPDIDASPRVGEVLQQRVRANDAILEGIEKHFALHGRRAACAMLR